MKQLKEIMSALLFGMSGGRIVTKTAQAEIGKRQARRARRAEELQEALNKEHWERYGWLVRDHQVIIDKY